MREQAEEQQMRECTFAPRTLRPAERRGFQEFLKDQQRHVERRREGIRRMAEESKAKEEQSVISVPRINEQSKVMSETKVSQPVHERLFPKSRRMTVNEEKIEKKRATKGTPREFSLYEEAKQRQKRLEERIKKEGFMSNRPIKEYSKDPYIKQKFNKEFSTIVESMEVADLLLTYSQMSMLGCELVEEVLARLNFVKSADDSSDDYSVYCTRMWEVLEGDQRGGILPANLKSFAGAVMKVILTADEPGSTTSRYGSFTKHGVFLFTQEQAARIHKDFCLFYLNRTAYNMPKPKVLKESECTFKPSLCEHSVTIANTTRSVSKVSTFEYIDQLLQSKEKNEL